MSGLPPFLTTSAAVSSDPIGNPRVRPLHLLRDHIHRSKDRYLHLRTLHRMHHGPDALEFAITVATAVTIASWVVVWLSFAFRSSFLLPHFSWQIASLHPRKCPVSSLVHLSERDAASELGGIVGHWGGCKLAASEVAHKKVRTPRYEPMVSVLASEVELWRQCSLSLVSLPLVDQHRMGCKRVVPMELALVSAFTKFAALAWVAVSLPPVSVWK